jgi:hypothetical protein
MSGGAMPPTGLSTAHPVVRFGDVPVSKNARYEHQQLPLESPEVSNGHLKE